MSNHSQPMYQPPQPIQRSQSSSTNPSKYVPEVYVTPSWTGMGYPNPYGAPVAPRAEPLIGAPPIGVPIIPNNVTNPAAAAASGPPPSTRTIQRQRSYESTHSKRSYDSRNSAHGSHKSYDRSRRSAAGDRGKDREHHHRHHGDRRHSSSSSKRYDDHRPTLGESIFAVIGGFKNYLGSRDRW